MDNQYSNKTVKNAGSPSWALIIFLLILFWPIGLFFLVRKLSVDRQASLSSGKKMTIWGWVIVGVGIMSWGSLMEDGFFSGTFGMLFFVILGLVLVRMGKKSSVNAVKYKKYIDLIVNKRLRSIRAISSAMPVSHDVAIQDVQEMISKGYFDNAYIDFNADEVVFIDVEETRMHQPLNAMGNGKVEMRLVPCNGCGANNKVPKGEVGKCQYCGSLIGG